MKTTPTSLYVCSMPIVAALYKFTRFPDPAALIPSIRAACENQGVKGILLLAPEGINGTISGTRQAIDAALSHIKRLPGCTDLEWKESQAETSPFSRLKVRLKKEIVTMGQPDVDPVAQPGQYVVPEDWNGLITAPDVAVIDTRNDYEVAIGTFKGAVNPATKAFGDFPAWWAANKNRFEGQRIAMICTGGIRCEKSTNYLLSQGVTDVFHLKGGILKYLEDVPEEDSLWNGACFVFDERVSVEHGLTEGPHLLCRACRRPVRPADRSDPAFEEGVSCHHCIDETTAEAKTRFRERQKQIALAAKRGERHLGQD